MDGIMDLGDFHFAQPIWLWGLIVIPIGIAWAIFWQRKRKIDQDGLSKFIDPNLMPHILLSPGKVNKTSIFPWLYLSLVLCVFLALANPRWSYKDIDAYQPTASMVILLDLSATMNAEDVPPSRIIRARQSLEDLLNLSKGLKIGLIGFAAIPHLISPITDDLQTIKTYLPALDTDLTNLQGDELAPALTMAQDLLLREPGSKKSILLVSDGDFESNDYLKQVSALAADGIDIYVMGVGTTTGAPYRDQSGNMHKVDGRVVTTKLNKTILQDIAKQGHGAYIEANHSEFGVQAILNKAEYTADKHQLMEGKIRQWDDRYYIFLFPAAMIMLYLMRKRALFMLAMVIVFSTLQTSEVYAMSSLFRNSEQRGLQEFQKAEFGQAADTFRDPYRKGVALYRAGDYAAAEEQFSLVKRKSVKVAAQYNEGNAQMQQQKWQAAINSYEAVLKAQPDNDDAKHNLDLARKMLSKQAQNNEGQDQNQQDKKDSQNKEKNQDQNQDQKQQDQQSKQDQQPDQNDQQQKQDQQKQDQQKNEQQQDQQKNEQQQDQAQDQKDQNQAKSQASNTGDNEANSKLSSAEQARADQWLNRIDSDIKVFLKNKFYIEDMLTSH